MPELLLPELPLPFPFELLPPLPFPAPALPLLAPLPFPAEGLTALELPDLLSPHASR